MEKNNRDGAPIPSSVYAAVVEALDISKGEMRFWTCTDAEFDASTARCFNAKWAYTGPTDAAEFLFAVNEPMRAWLQDDRNLNAYGDMLREKFRRSDSWYTATQLEWFIRTCTPEQQVRALAAAMGIEVES